MYDTLLDRELDEESSPSTVASELHTKIEDQESAREVLSLAIDTEQDDPDSAQDLEDTNHDMESW